jgi:hypothetical protein
MHLSAASEWKRRPSDGTEKALIDLPVSPGAIPQRKDDASWAEQRPLVI